MKLTVNNCPFLRIAHVLKGKKKNCGTRRIYLDHGATTPLQDKVKEAMLPYLGKQYGNPSSFYKQGVEAKQAIDAVRERLGRF